MGIFNGTGCYSVQVYFHNLSVKWGHGHESDPAIFTLSGE